MKADDFEKQPRGPYHFDFWLSKQPISTPMGDFIAELRELPNEELLQEANVLTAFVRVTSRKSGKKFTSITSGQQKIDSGSRVAVCQLDSIEKAFFRTSAADRSS
jgi:hypothetical protein